jgi:hypothetical protein
MLRTFRIVIKTGTKEKRKGKKNQRKGKTGNKKNKKRFPNKSNCISRLE